MFLFLCLSLSILSLFLSYVMSDVRIIDASYKKLWKRREKKRNFDSIVTMTTYEEQDRILKSSTSSFLFYYLARFRSISWKSPGHSFRSVIRRHIDQFIAKLRSQSLTIKCYCPLVHQNRITINQRASVFSNLSVLSYQTTFFHIQISLHKTHDRFRITDFRKHRKANGATGRFDIKFNSQLKINP